MSVGNDTDGITGIPSTVAGRGDREKSGTNRQHKGGFIQVQAAMMRKTLRSCFGGYISVLELSN